MDYFLTWGYLGLFLGSFLSATILPLSSELLVSAKLLAGASSWTVLLVATAGNWLGSLSTYGIGWLGKWEWIEKWFKTSPEKMEAQQTKIIKYGSLLAFLVWLPVVGDMFALALGFYKVNFAKCSTFMLVGKFVRFFIYIMLFDYIGKWFGFEI